MDHLISTTEALRLILQYTQNFGIESCPIEQAGNRVLREDLYADRDFPPYDRVSMDGIALSFSVFEKGQRQFAIAGIAPAGAPQKKLDQSDQCLEVMTGAVLPSGADTVIRYEDLKIAGKIATVSSEIVVEKGQNVHGQGTDRTKGSKVVARNIRLSPAEIGIAATVGKSSLEVARLPKTVVISTGDELVPVDAPPLPFQIRRSNSHRLQAALQFYGIQADLKHLDDRYQTIVHQLEKLLTTYDLIILSGGVSKGKFDFLPKALDQLGVIRHFHKVAQRPGKPLWFGTYYKTTLFALPGNPVSAFACTLRYIYSWLDQCLGSHRPPIYARLAESVTFKPDLTYFMQVHLQSSEDAQLLATPVQGGGSGDLANLARANAFMEIPRGRTTYEAGEIFPVFPFKGWAL